MMAKVNALPAPPVPTLFFGALSGRERRGDYSMPSVVMSSNRGLPGQMRVSPRRVAPTGAGMAAHACLNIWE